MLLLLISTLIKIGIVLGILLGIAPLLVWAERRQSAMIQDRVGPVRAGIPVNFAHSWLIITAGAGGLSATAFLAAGALVVLTELYVLAAVLTLVGAGAGGLALYASSTKTTIAQLLQGPASFGAMIVAYLCLGGAIVAALLLGATFYAENAVASSLTTMHEQHVAAQSAQEEAQRQVIRRDWEGELASLERIASLGNPEAQAMLAPLRDAAARDPLAVPDVEPAGTFAPFQTQFTVGYTVFGWAIAIFLLLAGFHFAASWIVKNLVDKRGHLTAFGFIHPAVDAVKAIWKEDFTPPKADRFLYSAAPIIATIPAFATFAVVPFGPDLLWGPEMGDFWQNLIAVIPEGAAVPARVVPLQVANINVGILFVFAIAGTGIVGAAIAGYSSDNKYALLGGLRAASQMVSYEVTLGLTLVGCFMIYGTLLLDEMVAWQQEHVWGFLVQPLALILFFFAAIAEMKRIPFDAPEGESEIVAGYFLEYSGMKFVMFMMGEFIEHIVSSAIIVTIFFGGYDIPFLHQDGFHFDFLGFGVPMPHILVVLLSVVAFLVKVILCCFLQLQVRWTLPRFRYDQIMQLCWKLILPLSLANILITGLVILLLE